MTSNSIIKKMNNTSQGVITKNTKLEAFLERHLGAEESEFVYAKDGCVEDNKNLKIFIPFVVNKFGFRLIIIHRDYLFITDNPPKNLNNRIDYEDILEIKMVDDIPVFLDGDDKKNALHMSIKYRKKSEKMKKKELIEIKKKILDLKKDMLFTNSLKLKMSSSMMNTPRTYRSDDLLLPINTDYSLQLTNRTNKSVRFDDENINPEKMATDERNDNIKDYSLDGLVVTPRTEKYIKLLNSIEMPPLSARSDTSTYSKTLNLSLPLTLDPMSTFRSYDNSNTTALDKQTSRSVESLNMQNDKAFLVDCEKEIQTIDLYLLNPKTQIIEMLKMAHFNYKIRATMDFHLNKTHELVPESPRTKSKYQITQKFNQLKLELVKNIDDVNACMQLIDELLCATKNHYILKKLFWNASDLFILLIKTLDRYLPESPANLSIEKAKYRRLQELECCITIIECLTSVFNETEFYESRNEILKYDKSKNLKTLTSLLLCDPEISCDKTKLSKNSIYSFQSEIDEQLCKVVLDMTFVSSVLLWELIHFTRMNHWLNEYFNFDILIKDIDKNPNIELYLTRLIGELRKIITNEDRLVLTSQETVIAYKMFSLIDILFKHSTKCLNFVFQNFNEEFRYYFNVEKIKSKCFEHYPIYEDFIKIIENLSKYFINT